MNVESARVFRRIRIICQLVVLLLFLFLFFYPDSKNLTTWNSTSLFFYIDPLLLITKFLVSYTILPLLLLSLIPLVLSLFLGRFFCGWICPMGTINQFVSWVFAKLQKKKQGFNKRILKVKYYILIIILSTSILGMNIAGWIDPFSFLTRSLTLVNPSGNYLSERGKELLGIANVSNQKNLPAIQNNEVESDKFTSRISSQAILVGGLFILMVGLNYYRRRFFCNVICPLGAVFGLLAKLGILHFKTSKRCNNCDTCSRNCTYNGNAGNNYIKSECTVCLNCTVDCPKDSVIIEYASPIKNNDLPVDLSRRKMVASVGIGMAFASFAKIQGSSNTNRQRSFIRPPGAISENEFLTKCSSCGQCTQACPTGFIQPASINEGMEVLWTPIGKAKEGYCAFDCNKCTQVCPSEALNKISLKVKQNFKIGLAVIDKNKCYTYVDGINCTVCYDKCPVSQKAIMFKEEEVWNYRGRITKVNQIHVLPDRCIGCGICEFYCPRHDSSGIFITSENEYRTLSDLT